MDERADGLLDLGGVSEEPVATAAAGLVTERTEGAVAQLSAAMYSDPAPWCPSMF